MMGKLTAVTAAAGAGKTFRIVEDIIAEVATRPPEEIVATTFTTKAADELIERARARLFEKGHAKAAARLMGARFGTVNAVCGQIVSEFALELGRSPSTAVVGAENEPLIFSIAADSVISAYAPKLNPLADRFGYSDPRPPFGGEAPDWRRTVRQIITLARSNGMNADQVRSSVDRSIKTYRPLFSQVAPDGAALDVALKNALLATMAAQPEKLSAKAEKIMPTIRNAIQAVSRGEDVSWPTWSKLTKVECAPTKDGPEFADAISALIAAAGQHAIHPRLIEDSELFIRLTFDCAADALSAYQDWKSQRGLLDFTDQEALALEVVRNPEMAARLRERISRVFVDEFQDSSPLQLAIFTALAEIVQESTWVGDPKQAIYGFRGADTNLTQAAFTGAAADKDPSNILSKSWRSRPGIVELSNAMFSPVLERMGLPAAEHAFSGTNRSDDDFKHPALGWWTLTGTNEEKAEALAGEIASCLKAADEWMVTDRAGYIRPLSIGDIAVLCRTNTEVKRHARALSQAGLAVNVERSGLAQTPHVQLVLSACRFVADAHDRLALAELARFFSNDPVSDAWLTAASDAEPDLALSQLVPVAGELSRLRDQSHSYTPAELVDAVMSLPEIIGRIEHWADVEIRLNDLEALRGVARSYEEECVSSGASATLSGLLLAIEESPPARPPSVNAAAIQVMTYHKAKGLEWPMAILAGLGAEPKSRNFEPVVEVDGKLDWHNPLANRWIRFWPWPYGAGGKGSALDMAATNSTFGKAAWLKAKEEDTRLLYVGVTRARDYLIFAPPVQRANWLNVLNADDGSSHLVAPTQDNSFIGAGDSTFAAVFRVLKSDGFENLEPPQTKVPHVSVRSAKTATVQPLFLTPSSATGAGWIVAERYDLGSRLKIDGVSDMAALGEALHAILAYDDITRSTAQRLADASAILHRWNVPGLSAEDAIEASNRLQTWLSERWPQGEILRECPVRASISQQIVQGRIDLLVRSAGKAAIIDHKSFPGALTAWDERAIAYAPQLGLYAQAITATGILCDECWVHMPVVGKLLRVIQGSTDQKLLVSSADNESLAATE